MKVISFFEDAFVNFNNSEFISKDTKILFHKALFDDEEDN